MNTEEKLKRIRAKCEERIKLYGNPLPIASAGWLSTIAAIDMLEDLPTASGWEEWADRIISAWPEELL